MRKLKRFLLVLLSAVLMSGVVSSVSASVITLDETTDLGVWQNFYFNDVGSYGTDTYQFSTTTELSFFVTDAFAIGDRFEIFDGSASLGLTSNVAESDSVNLSDAQSAYDSGLYSTGEWVLGPGTYDISVLVASTPYGRGGAFVKLDTSSAAPVPEPATMILFGIGLLGLAGVSRKKR